MSLNRMKQEGNSAILDNASLDSERELDKVYSKFPQHVDEFKDEDSVWYDPRFVKDVSSGVRRRLVVVTCVCVSFIVVETIGAVLSNSIAILTDVAHLLSDLLGFIFSIFALFYAKKEATKKHTWGFARAEIIGAFCSVIVIWVLTLWIYYEAISRIWNRSYGNLKPQFMVMTATFGIFANLVMMKALHSTHSHGHGFGHSHDHGNEHGGPHDHDHSTPHLQELKSKALSTSSAQKKEKEEEEVCLKHRDHSHDSDHSSHDHPPRANLSSADEAKSENVRAAFIHIIGDLVASIGVLLGAIIIYLKPEWCILDPILSILFSTIALSLTFPVMHQILSSMLDVTPENFDIERFEAELSAIKFLERYHDLHVWQISIGKPALTVHIVCSDHAPYVLKKATVLARTYGIYHSTIQVERADRLFAIDCSHNVHT